MESRASVAYSCKYTRHLNNRSSKSILHLHSSLSRTSLNLIKSEKFWNISTKLISLSLASSQIFLEGKSSRLLHPGLKLSSNYPFSIDSFYLEAKNPSRDPSIQG